MRRATVTRRTTETRIEAAVDLDGSGHAEVATGVGSSTTCSSRSPGTRSST